ncbi:OmpA family protein [Taibaiella soli]|uniref:OmpA-like domain-containing protein n=1 Tax=Taibaiella soli TaxID=1649169 RepID=A0A2W2BLE1_9BACT|nr:OmpA family protein [Taibaiella soli]PZF74246.1 hypothetical protein DN068_04320 [Taibaiella soli]
MKKILLFLRCIMPGLLLTAAFNAFSQQKGDTIAVYFAFNKSIVNDATQSYLDSLLYNEVLTPDKDVKIIGYADYVGTNIYNDTLSQKRAIAIQDYLYTMGFKADNIHLVVGNGKIERKGMKDLQGYAPDRKVDIVLTHAELKRKAKLTPPVKKQEEAPAAASINQQIKQPVFKKKVFPPAITVTNLEEITQLKVDETVVLNKIYFPAGRHYATEGSQMQMDQLYDVLTAHPSLRIRIEGHVCCVYWYTDAYDEDTQSYNLSVNRARYVYGYLLRRGVDPDRLDFIGFGRTRPVIQEEHTEEEAQLNRRVEIRILSK